MKRLFWILGIVIVIAGMVGAYLLWVVLYKPNVNTASNAPIYLYIPTGGTFQNVKDSLYSKNLISQKEAFELLAKKKNYIENVRPGRYRIKPDMTNNELINMLRAGLQEPLKLTFNNIRTKGDLAGKVARKIEADSMSIVDVLNDNTVLKKYRLNSENAMVLFIPNTYEILWNTSAKEFLERMAREYKNFWTAERKKKAREIGLDPVEVSVLASIVEAETVIPSEKPIIAGVYLNRIHKGIHLEADPTLIWAWNDFSIHRVLDKHKALKSPYNTYMYAGLPPGPINLPSVSSIDAVLNYQKHKFLYFCAREDLSGYSNFACTYSDHLKNAAKYQKELNRRGIKS